MTALDEIRRDYEACVLNGTDGGDDFITTMELIGRLFNELDDFRPRWLDEVAARCLAGALADPNCDTDPDRCARAAYNAAEALIAEGKRRRGEGE